MTDPQISALTDAVRALQTVNTFLCSYELDATLADLKSELNARNALRKFEAGYHWVMTQPGLDWEPALYDETAHGFFTFRDPNLITVEDIFAIGAKVGHYPEVRS